MRLHKLLFLIFLVLYFIAGLSLLITGSVAHRHAKQYAEVTGYSLMSGAGFIIGLGVIILVLCLLGFYAAQANKLNFLTAFIITLGIILLLQLIAAIVAFTLRGKADNDLRTNMKNSMNQYDGNTQIQKEWNSLQQEWKCCGISGSGDWNTTTSATRTLPPSSCCPPDKTCSALQPNYYKDGCYNAASNLFYRYSKALGGVAIFFFFIEIIGLVLAVVLLRDLKHNYGTV